MPCAKFGQNIPKNVVVHKEQKQAQMDSAMQAASHTNIFFLTVVHVNKKLT